MKNGSEPISSAAATMRPQRVIGSEFFRTVLMEVAIAMIAPTIGLGRQPEFRWPEMDVAQRAIACPLKCVNRRSQHSGSDDHAE